MRARVDIGVAPLALLASLGVSVLAAGFSGGLWTVSFQALYGSLHVPFVIAVLPVVALGVALLLVAVLARRWGWVVAAGGVAGQLVITLHGGELAVVFHPIGLEIVYAAVVGGTLGGLATAFGVVGRWARLGIGAGLALGLVAARAVVFVLNGHTNPLATVTFGLCAVVAAVSLADWPAVPIAWE